MARQAMKPEATLFKLAATFKTDFPGLIARATPLELGPPVGWPLKYRVTGPDHTEWAYTVRCPGA